MARIEGTEFNDILLGTKEYDRISGFEGNDNLDGSAGDDELYGGDGDDTLVGGNGWDKLYGGVGNDLLDGGAGRDELYGGDGDDTLVGGQGHDRMIGGRGADLFLYEDILDFGDRILDFDPDQDRIDLRPISDGADVDVSLVQRGAFTLVYAEVGEAPSKLVATLYAVDRADLEVGSDPSANILV